MEQSTVTYLYVISFIPFLFSIQAISSFSLDVPGQLSYFNSKYLLQMGSEGLQIILKNNVFILIKSVFININLFHFGSTSISIIITTIHSNQTPDVPRIGSDSDQGEGGRIESDLPNQIKLLLWQKLIMPKHY